MKIFIAIVWTLLIFGGSLAFYKIINRGKLTDWLIEQWIKLNEMDTH